MLSVCYISTIDNSTFKTTVYDFCSLKIFKLKLRVRGLERPVGGLSPPWPPPGYATNLEVMYQIRSTKKCKVLELKSIK